MVHLFLVAQLREAHGTEELNVESLLEQGKLKFAPLKTPDYSDLMKKPECIIPPIMLSIPEAVSYESVGFEKMVKEGAYILSNRLFCVLPNGIYSHKSDFLGVCKPQEGDLIFNCSEDTLKSLLIVWNKRHPCLEEKYDLEQEYSYSWFGHVMKKDTEDEYKTRIKLTHGTDLFAEQFSNLGYQFDGNIALSGKNILVIDDNKSLAQLFEKIPNSEGFFPAQHIVSNSEKDWRLTVLETYRFASQKNILLDLQVCKEISNGKSRLEPEFQFRLIGDLKKQVIEDDLLQVVKTESNIKLGGKEEDYYGTRYTAVICGNSMIPVDPYSLLMKELVSNKHLEKDQDDFQIRGKNDTDAIKKLKKINGISIPALEQFMKSSLSFSGFLGREERLLDVLAQDNKFVVDENNLTHVDMARPLKLIMKFHMAGMLPDHECFLFGGKVFLLKVNCYMGYQDSPFLDGTTSRRDYNIWNLTDGTAVSFSGLVPDMIERYGFYEGDTKYRLPPEKILEVFGDVIRKKEEPILTQDNFTCDKILSELFLIVYKLIIYPLR